MSSASCFNKAWPLAVAFVICVSGLQPARTVEAAGKARARVFLSDLARTYDGAPKPAGARTEPEGLMVIFTYDGSASAPSDAGVYTVVGTVMDANYEGSATGKLTIARAGQKIDFEALPAWTYGEATFELSSTTSSGLTADYASSNPAVAVVSGNRVRIAGAGTTQITAYQAGDKNHLPAKPVKRVLTVNKAKAKVTLIKL